MTDTFFTTLNEEIVKGSFQTHGAIYRAGDLPPQHTWLWVAKGSSYTQLCLHGDGRHGTRHVQAEHVLFRVANQVLGSISREHVIHPCEICQEERMKTA